MSLDSTSTTSVGNLDPNDLGSNLQENPGLAGETIRKIHAIPDRQKRCELMLTFSDSLQRQPVGTTTSITLCDLEPLCSLDQVLTKIVLEDQFLCGIPREEFCGAQLALVCPSFSHPTKV